MQQAWTRYKIHYRYGQTVYHITILRLAADATKAAALTLDGTKIPGRCFRCAMTGTNTRWR